MQRKQLIAAGALLMLSSLPIARQADAQDVAKAWQGHYRYAFDGGRTVGGSPIFIDHTLAIGPSGSRGGCLLSSRGFQADEQIVCHVAGDASKLSITFHGYPDGKLVNRYGVAVYKPGQVLLVLQRRGDDTIQTTWEAFRPGDDQPAPGVYFRKQS